MAEPMPIDWLNALPTAVLVVRDTRVLLANRAAADLIDCSPGELTGVSLSDLLTGAADAASLTTRAGVVVPVSYTDAEVEHEGRPARLITILKRAPGNIFRDAIEAGIDNFFMVQIQRTENGDLHDFLMLDANERAIQNVGLTRDGFIGHTVRELFTEESPSGWSSSCQPCSRRAIRGIAKSISATRSSRTAGTKSS